MPRAGWPVFPCEPGAKHPFAGSHGFKDASTDLETVGRWWDIGTDANIAAPDRGSGGRARRRRQEGGDGYRALHRLARAGLLKGAVAEAETRNAGRHYYYPPADPHAGHFVGTSSTSRRPADTSLLPPSKVPADEGMEDRAVTGG